MVGTPPPSPSTAPGAGDVGAQKSAAAAAQEERDAALAHTQQAEEAAAAAKDREATTARKRAALERAAREHHAAAGHPPLPPPPNGDKSGDHDDDDVHDAMLLHEAIAALNLHAQAMTVQNISSLVTVVLDVTSGDYTWWRDQFILILGKYSLQGHVLFDNHAAAGHTDWARMDCVVKSWLYGTLSTELANSMMDGGYITRTAWLAVETQFHGNRDL